MKVFSIDVRVAATVYIKAKGKKAAQEVLDNFLTENFCFEVAAGGIVSDDDYASPLLPTASLSPAMTLEKVLPGAALQLVIEGVPA